jgi:hypothetical protein
VQRGGRSAAVVVVRGDVEVGGWPLAGSERPDLTLVDGLARLQLAAYRAGCAVRVVEANCALRQLLQLAGLSETLLGPAALSVEVCRQPERGEQTRVDEAVVPDDPIP